MGFPATRDQLKESGYRFDNHAKCRGEGCDQEVEWWITPRGKKMPFNLMLNGDSPAVAHFVTCPASEEFRRR